jgi:hypothetical protein
MKQGCYPRFFQLLIEMRASGGRPNATSLRLLEAESSEMRLEQPTEFPQIPMFLLFDLYSGNLVEVPCQS